jgi:hypothetical protein
MAELQIQSLYVMAMFIHREMMVLQAVFGLEQLKQYCRIQWQPTQSM